MTYMKYLKIIGGTLLMALGLFLLLQAFISLDSWEDYIKEKGEYRYAYHHKKSLSILDNVPLLILVGLPSIVIGIILVTKGAVSKATNKKAEEDDFEE